MASSVGEEPQDGELAAASAGHERAEAPPEAYDPVAKALHWGMALAIFAMVGLGLYMSRQSISMETFRLYDLHKSLGLSLLGLAVLRLAWRLARPRPALLTHGVKPWELRLASVVHVLLYALMIAMPIIGWIGASASGLPMTYFGIAAIPAIVPSSETVQNAAFAVHFAAAMLLLLVIGLHIAGALKRHLLLRDDTLVRMLPFGSYLGRGIARPVPVEKTQR